MLVPHINLNIFIYLGWLGPGHHPAAPPPTFCGPGATLVLAGTGAGEHQLNINVFLNIIVSTFICRSRTICETWIIWFGASFGDPRVLI